MAGFPKIWTGATSDYGLSTNWQAVSVRNSSYSWTLSGSGTNEYYLRTAANGNPGFAATPALVYINAASATSGSLGSLTAGQWGYGNNDTLGYSTIYVRLPDGTDPDSKAADYVKFYQIPKTDDDVAFPISGGGTVDTNLDQSAVAIDDFVTAAEWTGTIGSISNYLRIDPNRFEWLGGSGYLDLGATAIPITVKGTATPVFGYQSLYLRGTALTTVDASGGYLGLGANPGDSGTCTSLRVSGNADVLLGTGAAVTTVDMLGGAADLRCSQTTVNLYGGLFTLSAAAATTTVNLYGGEFRYASTANVGTVNQYGGVFNERYSGATRTITAYNYYAGQIIRFKEAVTHTAFNVMRSVALSGS